MAGGGGAGAFSPCGATGPDFSAGGLDKLRLHRMVSEFRNVMRFGRRRTSPSSSTPRILPQTEPLKADA